MEGFNKSYRPNLFPRTERVLKAVKGFFELHLLASHGDHFVRPFEPPIEPVTQIPGQLGGASTKPTKLV